MLYIYVLVKKQGLFIWSSCISNLHTLKRTDIVCNNHMVYFKTRLYYCLYLSVVVIYTDVLIHTVFRQSINLISLLSLKGEEERTSAFEFYNCSY